MHKKFNCLGLMSGTSGDGVDASIINSNGTDQFEVLKDKYYEYDSNIFNSFHHLKEKILNSEDLKRLSREIKDLERQITLFHAKIVNDLIKIENFSLVGCHGQTIYHNPEEKISFQLADGQLLSQLTKKKIIFNFRKNDILNGGEGAPLTPIYHQLIAKQKKIKLPTCILNIGGISNVTIINDPTNFSEIFSKDTGPGNCLIDSWVRQNSNQKFDKEGILAKSGKINEIIFEQAQELYSNRINKEKASFDTNDFDISFSRGLSIEDGAATLTEFTASILGDSLTLLFKKKNVFVKNILICGGGRKNKYLLLCLKKYLPSNITIRVIDEYSLNGDFIESQAFAFLAIRSYKKLPITFPNTTNCKKPCLGGEIIEN